MAITDTTSKPIPSNDADVLDLNAKNFDVFSNSEVLSYDDRGGIERKTLSGHEAYIQQRLEQQLVEYGGFVPTGPYQSGGFNYTVNMLFDEGGITYLVIKDFISTDFATDSAISPSLFTVQQGLSRSNGVAKISSVFDINSFANLQEGNIAELVEYHPDSGVGGGSVVVRTARHNGGTAISLDRARPADWGNETQKAAWFADSGVDELCAVRSDVKSIDLAWFGVKSDNSTVETIPVQKAADLGRTIMHNTEGTCLISGTITLKQGNNIYSQTHGKFRQTLENSKLFYGENIDGIDFFNIGLEGVGASDTASTVNSANNTDAAKAYGIHIDSSKNVKVKFCSAKYFKNDGVRISYSSDVLVEDTSTIGTHPDSDIPVGDTGRQQFGINIYAESCAEKGASMLDVMVNKTANRHLNRNIYINRCSGTDTAIFCLVFPGFTNVNITNCATYGQLTQHSIYAYPYKALKVSGNTLLADQAVGIKISNNVNATYANPSNISLSGNTIQNTTAPSISLEVFDKMKNGSFSINRASAWFKDVSINGINFNNIKDSAITLACVDGFKVSDITIKDLAALSSREAIVLRSAYGEFSDAHIKRTNYSIFGGAGCLGRELTIDGITATSCSTSAAGYYGSLSTAVTPFEFTIDRYVNWYGLGNLIYNSATDEVYVVTQEGVAGSVAPTGTSDVVSGEVVFKYYGLFADLKTPVRLTNNVLKVGEGTTAAIGAFSLNDPKFQLSVSNNYADTSINSSRFYGEILEWDGNNLINTSKSTSTFIEGGKGTAGNSFFGTAIPTSGTYEKGDIMWNLNVVAGGYIGWVCVARGTSGGTWRTFGEISA